VNYTIVVDRTTLFGSNLSDSEEKRRLTWRQLGRRVHSENIEELARSYANSEDVATLVEKFRELRRQAGNIGSALVDLEYPPVAEIDDQNDFWSRLWTRLPESWDAALTDCLSSLLLPDHRAPVFVAGIENDDERKQFAYALLWMVHPVRIPEISVITAEPRKDAYFDLWPRFTVVIGASQNRPADGRKTVDVRTNAPAPQNSVNTKVAATLVRLWRSGGIKAVESYWDECDRKSEVTLPGQTANDITVMKLIAAKRNNDRVGEAVAGFLFDPDDPLVFSPLKLMSDLQLVIEQVESTTGKDESAWGKLTTHVYDKIALQVKAEGVDVLWELYAELPGLGKYIEGFAVEHTELYPNYSRQKAPVDKLVDYYLRTADSVSEVRRQIERPDKGQLGWMLRWTVQLPPNSNRVQRIANRVYPGLRQWTDEVRESANIEQVLAALDLLFQCEYLITEASAGKILATHLWDIEREGKELYDKFWEVIKWQGRRGLHRRRDAGLPLSQ
jgi:hypothetical protein